MTGPQTGCGPAAVGMCEVLEQVTTAEGTWRHCSYHATRTWDRRPLGGGRRVCRFHYGQLEYRAKLRFAPPRQPKENHVPDPDILEEAIATLKEGKLPVTRGANWPMRRDAVIARYDAGERSNATTVDALASVQATFDHLVEEIKKPMARPEPPDVRCPYELQFQAWSTTDRRCRLIRNHAGSHQLAKKAWAVPQ